LYRVYYRWYSLFSGGAVATLLSLAFSLNSYIMNTHPHTHTVFHLPDTQVILVSGVDKLGRGDAIYAVMRMLREVTVDNNCVG
jgi:hypothetical protein